MNVLEFFKTKKVLAFLGLVFSFYLLLIASTNSLVLVTSDFLNYYVGSRIVATGQGSSLYNPEVNFLAQKEVLGMDGWKNINTFRPLPFVAVLLTPLTLFSAISAFKIFAFFNLTLAITFILISKELFGQIKRYKQVLLLIPLVYLSAIDNFRMGQVSLLLAFLLLLVYKFLKSGKSFLIGALLALLLIKTQYLVFAPFLFLLTKVKRRFIAGFLIVIAIFFLVSVKTVGIEQLLNYPEFLISTEGPEYGSRSYDFFSFYGLLMNLPFISVSKTAAFIINALFYITALMVFFKAYRSLSLEKAFVSATLFSLAFSVHIFSFDLCFLLVPIFILLNKIVDKNGLKINLDLVFAGTLFLLPALGYLQKPYYASVIMIVIGFCYLAKKGLFDHLFQGKLKLDAGFFKLFQRKSRCTD